MSDPRMIPAEGLSPTGRYARLSLPDDVKQVMEESVEDYKAGRFVDFDTPESFTEGMEAHISDPVNQTEDLPTRSPQQNRRKGNHQ